MTDHIRTDPLVETADLLRRGDRTAKKEADARLDRLATVESDIKAFVPEANRRERVLSEVAALPDEPPPHTVGCDSMEIFATPEWRIPPRTYSRQYQRPPLYGVPVGIKDVFGVDGLPTQAGSEVPSDVLGGPEAWVVDRLRTAGAIVLGKTVTTEFAYFEPGPTRNPHDTGHTPGGSSSGSAAAVAAGEVPLAIGTQTAGSTIRPAAFCGVVGFKPSYGRIPTDGLLPLSPSLDHVGLFTQDAAGMQLAASICCEDWTAAPSADEPVLAVPDGPYLEQADAAGIEQFEQTVAALRADGYEVRRGDALGDIETINERHTNLLEGEAALVHHDWYEAHGEAYASTTAKLVERGRRVTVGDIADARASRATLRERLTEQLVEMGADCWLAPAAPGPAPAGLDQTGDVVMNLPWTHAGMPVVSLPAGTISGLPLGVQIVAPIDSDERLLGWAQSLEQTVADR